MAPFVVEIVANEKEALEVLQQELTKGVQSMKDGEVFTLEEAWEEIDKI